MYNRIQSKHRSLCFRSNADSNHEGNMINYVAGAVCSSWIAGLSPSSDS